MYRKDLKVFQRKEVLCLQMDEVNTKIPVVRTSQKYCRISCCSYCSRERVPAWDIRLRFFLYNRRLYGLDRLLRKGDFFQIWVWYSPFCIFNVCDDYANKWLPHCADYVNDFADKMTNIKPKPIQDWTVLKISATNISRLAPLKETANSVSNAA